MIIDEIMTRNVITITPDETIQNAMMIMDNHHIRHLPVVDNTGSLVGLVSDRDLKAAGPSRLKVHDDDPEILGMPVSSVMKTEVITCHPMDFVEEAAYILYENHIGCLPVLQNAKLVGIVTKTDILHTLVELMGVHQPSSHIEVEVPDRAGVLADVAAVFKECKINVSSVLVYPGKKANTRRLVFRVRTMDPRKALQLIEHNGFQIIWPVESEGRTGHEHEK